MSGYKYKRKKPHVPYNKEEATKAKTTKQLQEELKKFEEGLRGLTEDFYEYGSSFYKNHIAYLRMKIAERIGK